MCHSRLPIIDWSNVVRNKHYVCYAIEYMGVFYGSGIWSTPVAANRMQDGNYILELRRMALFNGCPKNTASWFLKKMRKDISIRFKDLIKLVSYQDVDVHSGTIYKADNWSIGNISTGQKWSTSKRKRNKEQSLSDKIRWEYTLKAKTHENRNI